MHLVHCIAECTECDWRCESFNGMAVGARHNQSTGHEVRVETGWAHKYEHRQPKRKPGTAKSRQEP